MALDGSFKLESALERFLSRCPALQHLSPFDALIKKGYAAVAEDEIVNIAAELFLNPNYTIPLLGSILNYFQFAPCPFQRIMIKGTDTEVCSKVGLLAVRLSYRLLLVEPETFSERWDWSCFLGLVKKLSNVDQGDVPDIRWCVIQILSVILKLGYEVTTNLTSGFEKSFSCLLRWGEFYQDVSLEKASWYIELFEEDLGSQSRTTDFITENYLPVNCGLSNFAVLLSDHVEIQPPVRRRCLATCDTQSAGNSFVLTSSIKKSYGMVMLALSQKWPILLYGPPGAGKSALINKLASDSHNQANL